MVDKCFQEVYLEHFYFVLLEISRYFYISSTVLAFTQKVSKVETVNTLYAIFNWLYFLLWRPSKMIWLDKVVSSLAFPVLFWSFECLSPDQVSLCMCFTCVLLSINHWFSPPMCTLITHKSSLPTRFLYVYCIWFLQVQKSGPCLCPWPCPCL